jgi:hypothetical protein
MGIREETLDELMAGYPKPGDMLGQWHYSTAKKGSGGESAGC